LGQLGALAYRKQPQTAAIAVVRELVGFLWAVMREVDAAPAHSTATSR